MPLKAHLYPPAKQLEMMLHYQSMETHNLHMCPDQDLLPIQSLFSGYPLFLGDKTKQDRDKELSIQGSHEVNLVIPQQFV